VTPAPGTAATAADQTITYLKYGMIVVAGLVLGLWRAACSGNNL